MPDVTTLLQGWERDLRRKGLSEFNNHKRATYVKCFATWLEPRPLLEATPAEIEDWLDSKALVSRTRAWYISHLTTFFDWCVREGHLAMNPARRVTRPRVPRLLPRPWSEETFTAAVSKADPRMRCWLLLAGLAGLRCKEIAGLRREDVLDTATPPMLRVHSGKGGHQRLLPVHPDLLAALHAYGMPPQGLLWRSQRTKGKARTSAESVTMLRPNTVSAYIARFLHANGLDATAHQGRHRFATRLYQESHDIRMVQELMGHASPMTTAIYAGWDSGKAAGMVAGIGSVAPRLESLTRAPSLGDALHGGATLDDITAAVTDTGNIRAFAESVFLTSHDSAQDAVLLRGWVDALLVDRRAVTVLFDPPAPPADQTDVTRFSWAAECMENPDAAARLWLLLPNDVRADITRVQEELRLPAYRLVVEPVTSARCDGCHGAVSGLAALVGGEDITYCGPCLRAAADAISA